MRCNVLRLALLAVGLISIIASARPVLAAPTVFFDRDDATAGMTSFPNSQAKFNEFTSTLFSFGMDNIESHFGPNPTLTFGATGIQAATQGVFATTAPGFGITINDVALAEIENIIAGPPLTPTFTFNQYITAFGVFVIQGGDAGNNNPTTFRLRDTATAAFVDVPVQVGPGWAFSNVFFLGVSDTVPFNEVTILETTDAEDGMLYDNIVAGNIPEPGSLVLVMIGATCFLGRTIRFRRR
jgi:hypothetical protein